MIPSSIFTQCRTPESVVAFHGEDLANASLLAERLRSAKDDFSAFLLRLLDAVGEKAGDRSWRQSGAWTEASREGLVEALNQLIRGGAIWRKSGFEKALGSDAATRLLPPDAQGSLDETRIARINRLLLEGVYTSEIWGTSTFCCAVGMSSAPCWDCETANPASEGPPPVVSKKSKRRQVPPNLGIPDDHELLEPCRFWSTGTLIDEQVVVTAAHAPRSPLVMGDRVLLPAVEGPRPFPQRILRVRRIIDHPKAASDPSCDVRLIILHYDEWGGEEQKARVLGIREEIGRRVCRLGLWQDNEEYALLGFKDVNASGFGRRFVQDVRSARGGDSRFRHGYAEDREFVISPTLAQKSGQPGPTSEFGDSGAPVVVRRGGEDLVVGMYVRRSTNRPVSAQPDLVVIRLHEVLRTWGYQVLARYGVRIPDPAGTEKGTTQTSAS